MQAELELKTSKTCCHVLRDLERRQLKLRALNTSASTASGVQNTARHLLAPAASLWPMDRIWFARTPCIYSPALTSPAPMTLHSPSWALRHSVAPAAPELPCSLLSVKARTNSARQPRGPRPQSRLLVSGKSLLLSDAAVAAQVGRSSHTSKPFISLPTLD